MELGLDWNENPASTMVAAESESRDRVTEIVEYAPTSKSYG
jgi:hypothetical protein